MATLEHIRNSLIDKIMSIKNKDFLSALEDIVSSSNQEQEIITISSEQKNILEMSEQDIQSENIIRHDDLKSKTEEWLKRKQNSK